MVKSTYIRQSKPNSPVLMSRSFSEAFAVPLNHVRRANDLTSRDTHFALDISQLEGFSLKNSELRTYFEIEKFRHSILDYSSRYTTSRLYMVQYLEVISPQVPSWIRSRRDVPPSFTTIHLSLEVNLS